MSQLVDLLNYPTIHSGVFENGTAADGCSLLRPPSKMLYTKDRRRSMTRVYVATNGGVVKFEEAVWNANFG